MSGDRLYRALLRAYPAEFRRRYGEEMAQSFRDLIERERVERGRRGVVAVWMGGLRDIVTRGTVERSFALRRRFRRHRQRQHKRDVMGAFVADVRYAVRTLVRRPVFTLAAVTTLGLGIGANTAIFSIVNTMLIRPLPYEDSGALVAIWSENPSRGWTHTDVTLPDAWDWRNRTGAFADLAVFTTATMNLTGSDRPERLSGARVTVNMMGMLGVQPAIGRDFTNADGAVGAVPVAILSDAFWARRFGRDPAILGQALTLNGSVHTVVGVMPEGFAFPRRPFDLWVPRRGDPAAASRTNHGNVAIARLAPGVSLEQANEEVSTLAATLAVEFPESNEGWGAYVVDLQQDIVGEVGRQASTVLMATVVFVLLIACANVANLMLARAGGREREIAVRTALGAGRGRLVRQLLTESLVLSLGGAAVGIGLGIWGTGWIVANLPQVPPAWEFGTDPTVLVFALLLAVGTAVIFGLAPALRASGVGTAPLRDGGRGGHGLRGRRLGSALVVAETALAVVLLAGGGIMMRSAVNVYRKDLGFQPDQVLTLRMSPPAAKYEGGDDLVQFYDRVLEETRAVPGVVSAGLIPRIPLGGSNTVSAVSIVGRPDTDEGVPVRWAAVTPGYFSTMGAQLAAGRDFTDADRKGASPVIMVNETFVRRYLPAGSPLDAAVVSGDEGPRRIVGVARDMFERGLSEPVRPAVYLPFAQTPARTVVLVVRGASDPAGLAPAVQEAVWRVDPDQPVFQVMPMRDIVNAAATLYGMIASLMGAFAMVSLALGAVGIYGVTSYSVGQRIGELGIRLALGARSGDVLRMVVGEGMRRLLLGIGLGVGAAALLVKGMAGMLVGVSPLDPTTFGAVAAILVAVGFLGSYLPARRACRVDPVAALKAE